jgi:xanthine/uracil permease
VSIAAVTFFVMVGVTVWGSSRLRLFGVLIGIGAGSLCAYASGLVTDEHLRR